MVVVLHHIGSPTTMIIAQKEVITQVRSRILSGDSGGGSFFFHGTLTALAGACSTAVFSADSAPAATSAGACDDVDIAKFCVWSHCLVDRST